MAANAPTAKNLAGLYKLGPLDWDDVRGTLETNLTQEPGPGGPGHDTFWLSTLDADGRPHITAGCAFGVAIHGYDVALEGRAARVTDDAQLRRLAQVFAEGGWAPTTSRRTS